MTKEIYAIFGGTFDPPHYGHLYPLVHCADLLGLPKIALMPANIPALKANITASKHRIEMTKRLCELDKRFDIELIEFERDSTSYTIETLKLLKTRHLNTTLVFIMGLDSLHNIHKWRNWEQIFSLCHVVVMARDAQTPLGSNLASNLYTNCTDAFTHSIYTNSEEFDQLVGSKMDDETRLMLLSKLAQAESASQGINQAEFMDIIRTSAEGKLWLLKNNLVPISSTQIREDWHARKDLGKFLPPSIFEYIEKNHLYK